MSMMSLAVTAGIEQTKSSRVSEVKPERARIVDANSNISTAAQLDKAVSVERRPTVITTSQPIPSDQVRVSVTTGQSNIRGNLSRNQAIELYKQISKML